MASLRELIWYLSSKLHYYIQGSYTYKVANATWDLFVRLWLFFVAGIVLIALISLFWGRDKVAPFFQKYVETISFIIRGLGLRTRDTANGYSHRPVVLCTLFFLLMNGSVLAQAWLDPAWGYRMAVTIDNTGNVNNLVEYQVKVELDNVSFDFTQAQSGGEDVRFTESDGTTLIDYWIEEWDDVGESAIVWAEVPSIPASASTQIYIYYGNLSVSSSSNGNETFDLFDDFETATIDWTNKWQSGNQSLYVLDGTLKGTHVVTNYQSSHSSTPYNYLIEHAQQVIKNHAEDGFWDPIASNWIRRLLWTGSGWGGMVEPHDWKYTGEMQEGSLYYALITGDVTLDSRIAEMI